MATRRVALFVDGDNVAPALAGPILAAATRWGRPDLRGVYAAEGGFRAWEEVAGFRAVRAGGAKNAADLLLCIDAVEAACRGGWDAFALASDDRDFTHLALWLRERGLLVLGLGTPKAPAGFRAACTAFEALAAPPPPPALPAPPRPPALSPKCPSPPALPPNAAPLTETDAQLRDLIRAEGQGGAIELGHLGACMGTAHRLTLARLGAPSWRAYLAARPALYALGPRGAGAKVRWIGP